MMGKTNFGREKTNPAASRVTTVLATPGIGPDSDAKKVSFIDAKIIGNGSFGVVYQAQLLKTREFVAIKMVPQDQLYRNRELDIMRKLNHGNIVKLKYFYMSKDERERDLLCLIMEYMPSTLIKLSEQYFKLKQSIPLLYVKLYMYQLFRSLAYLHSLGICHRDVKPQNLLINNETGILKLCDFGCAKQFVQGEGSVSYICSRYYRAPELLFSATDYTTMIDVWSAGCVLAELMLCRPIFPSEDCVSQLVEIIKVLGTPTKEEIKQMNRSYAEYNYPHLDPTPWQEVFRGRATREEIDLVSRLLVYTPSARITPLQACADKFFNKLREPGVKLFNKRELPPLFNFSEHELKIQPNLNSILIPAYLKSSFCRTSEDNTGMVGEPSSNSTDCKIFISDI